MKKIFSLVFIFAFIFCGAGLLTFASPTSANASNALYYNGLNQEEQLLYRNLNNLLETAETGKEKINIADPTNTTNSISQERLRDAVEGDSSLMISLNSAVDAFKFDNPLYFYVDFDKVDLMIFSQTGENYQYVAMLGYGGYGNIFYDYVSDVKDIKNKTTAIVDSLAAKTYPLQTRLEKLNCLNDEIIIMAKPDTRDNAPTILNALDGKASDLTYSQLFKLTCDKLGIPSYILNGTSTASQMHGENRYFNLVEINHKWYLNDLWSYANERTPFIFAGMDSILYTYQSGVALSGASKKIELPVLSFSGVSGRNLPEGFAVGAKARATDLSVINDFTISFKGKGLDSVYKFGFRTFKDSWSAWQNVEEEHVTANKENFVFNGEKLSGGKVEFCVYTDALTQERILFKSQQYNVLFENDIAPTSTYNIQNSTGINGAYSVTVNFSEELTQNVGEECNIAISSDLEGAAERVAILRRSFENNVLFYEFSLAKNEKQSPHQLKFNFQGVSGKYSDLAPQAWNIDVSAIDVSTSTQVVEEKLLRLSHPTLIKNSADFGNADGNDNVNLRYKKVEEKGGALTNTYPDLAFDDIEAYEVSFEKDGNSVQPTQTAIIALPYMKNYNMLSKKDFVCYLENGNEILLLRVVPNLYGLTIELPKSGKVIVTTQAQVSAKKTIYITQTGGGQVSEKGITLLEHNKSLRMAAEPDQVVYSVSVNGNVNLINQPTKEIVLIADDIANNSLIKVRFAPSDALSENGLTPIPVCPRASKPVIVSQDSNKRIFKNARFVLGVIADAPIQGELKYQWYLNDKLLKGENDSTLSATMSKATAGNYFVVVTNEFDGQVLSTQSKLINVNERSLSSYLTILYMGFAIFAVVYLIRFFLRAYKKPKSLPADSEALDSEFAEEEDASEVVSEEVIEEQKTGAEAGEVGQKGHTEDEEDVVVMEEED